MRYKVFLCLSIIGIAVVGCGKKEDPISSAIRERVRQGEGTTIVLADMTPFEWDRVYIFGPYENRDSIQKATGCPLTGVDDGFWVEEYDVCFVFIKDGKVVHHFTGEPPSPSFLKIANHGWFTPQTARFEVLPEKRLRPIEPNSTNN